MSDGQGFTLKSSENLTMRMFLGRPDPHRALATTTGRDAAIAQRT